MRIRRWSGVMVAVAALAGCRPAAPPATPSQPDRAELLPTPAEPVAQPITSAEELRQAIAAHRGQPVLVNFWATWCAPCVKEFPHLVALRDERAGDGLVLLTVSGDDPAKVDSAVKPFLAAHRAEANAYLLQAEDPAAFNQDFSPGWAGGFPTSFIYDRQGKLLTRLEGEQTPESLAAAVGPALAR